MNISHGAGGEATIVYRACESYQDWRAGAHDGTLAIPGQRTGVTMLRPAGTDGEWDYATWTSPLTPVGFPASELVPSWNAETPEGTWIKIEMQGTYGGGELTPWYVMGRWASGDRDIKRTTVNGQSDRWSAIEADTFAVKDPADGAMLEAYRLRLTLYRRVGHDGSPRVWMLGAMSSYVPERFDVPPGERLAWGTELKVPRRSQNIHRGNYPEWGGGGQVWCSPTSTTMVLEYWDRRPTDADLAWVRPGYTDPQIPHGVRMTWDHQFRGAGNWPFNTAYAATFGGIDAHVTRLGSLTDAERLISARIPVVASVAFTPGELEGARYSTAGHLLVIVGFTAEGDVIVNDPAAAPNEAVRTVYNRRQFETVWLRTKRINARGGVSRGSGGIVYLIRPSTVSLPPP